MYSALAAAILLLHLLFILWVVFGVVVTHHRLALRCTLAAWCGAS